MSRPTPNYFCVHTGFFRNDRTLSLIERIGERAFYVPQMLWSFAGENQMDGELSHLSVKQFRKIFAGCHLTLSEHETIKIVDALKEVGFIKNGRLHSWERFNRQFVELEKRQGIKRQAAFQRW